MSAEDALAKIEQQLLTSGALGEWLGGIDEIRRLLALGEPNVVSAALALGVPRVDAHLESGVYDAWHAGANDARDIIDIPGGGALGASGRPSKDTLGLVEGLDKAGREALARARALHTAGADDGTALSPLFGHANSVRGRVTQAVNASGNEGATAVADDARLPTVWVAETNACVHCLAYSGRVAKPGEAFPGGLTYGRKSYHPDPLPHPPLHPHCRCTIEPLNSQEYADALRREADRSVLRGFSLESESMGVRVDAADRLVKKGVQAPASVIKYAERSVKAGKFPTRDRPDGHGPPPGPGPVPPNKRPPSAPDPTPKADPTTPRLSALPKVATVSPADAATTSNPGNGLKGYDVNCYSCVSAAEMRARGYDVTAIKAPNAKGATPAEIAAKWKDADGAARPFVMDKMRRDFDAELADWPDDSRGFVAIQWSANRSGHIYSVHKTPEGKIVYTDPQKPLEAGKAEDYLDRATFNRIGVMRVDDMHPTDGVADWVVPNDAATNAKLEAAAAKKAALNAKVEAARAEYDRLNAASRVYFGSTPEGRDKYAEAIIAKNAAATAYNELLKQLRKL